MVKKITTLLVAWTTYLSLAPAALVSAQITNPAIGTELGGNRVGAESGQTFTTYFVQLWQAFITVGGVATLLYFIWGAIDWITAGGDSGKIEKARNKITQAIIGMVILVGSFAIIGFISTLFFGDNFDLLAPAF
jgi:hypothetical protein